MDFDLPADLTAYLAELDAFIEREIAPLQAQDDNQRFFDHRREWARTDFDNQGLPRPEWEALMAEARRRADRAGHLRFALPAAYGGRDGSHLWMAVIREHLAAKGLGLHNDLQTEHSIVANNPLVLAIRDFGTPAQREAFIPGMLDETLRLAFGLTEPQHGSDATHMATCAVREGRGGRTGWRIDGEKMWTTGMHTATHCVVFARTSGQAGEARGISAFLVPCTTDGVRVEEYLWTFNMPTDHPRVSLTRVWVDDDVVLGPLDGGLAVAQHFVHENRIRQAASSLGAADYCVRESVAYARQRKPPALVEQAGDERIALRRRAEVADRQHQRMVGDDRVLGLQVVVQPQALGRQVLADHRHPQVAAVAAAIRGRQRKAQVARAIGTAPRLGQQRLPLGTRQALVVEIGARPFATMIEEALVVVARLQRRDLAHDEIIELGQVRGQLDGQVEVHQVSWSVARGRLRR